MKIEICPPNLFYEMIEQVISGAKLLILTPFVFFIERYIFNDWNFGISILILMLLDGFIGLLVAFLKKEIKLRHMLTDWVLRSIILMFGIVSLSVIDLAMVRGIRLEALAWINSGFFVFFMGYIFAGILKNLYIIYPAEWIIKLREKLNKTEI